VASYNPNSDNRLADLLLELKRHLRTCKHCIGAIKTQDYGLLCQHSRRLVITAAWQYDTVIPRRLKAHRSGDHHVFACPDPSAHGKANSITAEPLLVVGVESTLF
jgi:recombinational DNA repair protein RecR